MNNAEADRIIEQMHPRVKERLVGQAIRKEIFDAVDEMVANGEIEFVPGTNHTQIRSVRRDQD
jgi:hypothetical protein